jgi:hypothetical protein
VNHIDLGQHLEQLGQYTATGEDLRHYQVHQTKSSVQPLSRRR